MNGPEWVGDGGQSNMHVVMTYPAHLALRGGDWAAAARRGGADVTEVVLADTLGTPAHPTVPWLAQPASRRYVIELPPARKPRKYAKRLDERIREALNIVADHHGAIDLLHTHSAAHSTFASRVVADLELPHLHSDESGKPNTSSFGDVYEAADVIRTFAGDHTAHSLPDAHRDRLRSIPTPIDSSVEGAERQLAALGGADSPLASPGEPWLAAIRPRKIVWRGNLASDEALTMVNAFAALRFTGTQLDMVGRDDADHEIKNLAVRLGLEGRLVVRPTGTPREMAQIIAQSDILVIGDNDPLLEREAMTALLLGTPVVTPSSVTYDELINTDLGAIVDPGDTEGVVLAIRQVAVVDVHNRRAMTARASRHTLAAVGSVLADVYHELAYGEARPVPKMRVIDGTDGRQIAS